MRTPYQASIIAMSWAEAAEEASQLVTQDAAQMDLNADKIAICVTMANMWSRMATMLRTVNSSSVNTGPK